MSITFSILTTLNMKYDHFITHPLIFIIFKRSFCLLFLTFKAKTRLKLRKFVPGH